MAAALPDYLEPALDLVLVGINPGLRSAAVGHHFAGHGNRFWDLLFASGLVPRRMSYTEDRLLPEHGIGITNIVARSSRSSSELGRADYREGRRLLVEKLARYRPRVAAFVGITVFREFWPVLASGPAPRVLSCGPRREKVGETSLFVVPNPSGRNAHFTYEEMLASFRRLKHFVARRRA